MRNSKGKTPPCGSDRADAGYVCESETVDEGGCLQGKKWVGAKAQEEGKWKEKGKKGNEQTTQNGVLTCFPFVRP